MLRDEAFSQSFMLLCFAAAGVLFFGLRQLSSTTPASQRLATPDREISEKRVLSAGANSSELVVDLSDRRVYLYRNSKLKASYRLSVGQPGWETPIGSFQVLQMYRNPRWRQPITGDIIESGRGNPLGDRWIGFWTDGRNQIGFHGTNQEQQVGKAVSHGCLRMRNQDIRVLYEQVSEGTPIIVRK